MRGDYLLYNCYPWEMFDPVSYSLEEEAIQSSTYSYRHFSRMLVVGRILELGIDMICKRLFTLLGRLDPTSFTLVVIME
jgi:hypothetical protein